MTTPPTPPPMWLPHTPSEIRSRAQAPNFRLTLTELVAAYTDVTQALFLARAANHPHPGEGAELAELALRAEIARDVSAGRGVSIGAARTAGATWAEIADALDLTEDTAHDEFAAWIDGQSHYYADNGRYGLDPAEETAARQLLVE